MYHPTYMSVFVLFQSALELLIHPDYFAQKIIELLLSSKTYRGGPYNLRGTWKLYSHQIFIEKEEENELV